MQKIRNVAHMQGGLFEETLDREKEERQKDSNAIPLNQETFALPLCRQWLLCHLCPEFYRDVLTYRIIFIHHNRKTSSRIFSFIDLICSIFSALLFSQTCPEESANTKHEPSQLRLSRTFEGPAGLRVPAAVRVEPRRSGLRCAVLQALLQQR